MNTPSNSETAMMPAEYKKAEVQEVPPSLQYLAALSPKHLTPITFSGENTGAQMNFEFTEDDKPVKWPEGNLSELSRRAINIIQELSTVRGAKIDAREGVSFVSDGIAWVQEEKGNPVDLSTIGRDKETPKLGD